MERHLRESGRTSSTTRRRPAADCPTSTTARSSTRSATPCECGQLEPSRTSVVAGERTPGHLKHRGRPRYRWVDSSTAGRGPGAAGRRCDSREPQVLPAYRTGPPRRPQGNRSAGAERPASARIAVDVSRRAAERVAFSFNLGKVAGQGEDCRPDPPSGARPGPGWRLRWHGRRGRHRLRHRRTGPRTGAYLASRVARDDRRSAHARAARAPEWNLDGPAVGADLRDSVRRLCATRLAELHAPRSGLRSGCCGRCLRRWR